MTNRIFVTANQRFGSLKYAPLRMGGTEDEAKALVEPMNRLLIKRWNEVVSPTDVVYHLGDFACLTRFSDIRKLLKQLNGKITLLNTCYDSDGEWMPYDIFTQGYGGIVFDGSRTMEVRCAPWVILPHRGRSGPWPPFPLLLTHAPMHNWWGVMEKDTGIRVLFGHTEGIEEAEPGRAISVGVERWSGYPVPLETLVKCLCEWISGGNGEPFPWKEE